MNKIQNGALPTYIIAGDNKAHRAKRLELFNHYLNHKGTDIPNGKKYSTDRTVIESIIASFGRQYIPDSFKRPYVFVPMCLDYLHHGHVNILKKSKKYGNIIIGLITDKGM